MEFDYKLLEEDPFAPFLRGQDSILKRCWYNKKPCIMKTYNCDMQQYFDEIQFLYSQIVKIKSEFIVELFGINCGKEIKILFEYCDMGSFDNFIPSYGEAFKVKVLKDVIKALKISHEFGIIVGELQPSKIFITSIDINRTSNCKLSIYGRHKRLDLKKMSLKEIQRSLAYRAPEVLTNVSLSKQSDVFSFGILMYETFSRQLPYTLDDGSFSVEAMMRITQESALTRKPSHNEKIWDTIVNCCKFDPNGRVSLNKINETLEQYEQGTIYYGESCPINKQLFEGDIFKIINTYSTTLQQWTNMQSCTVIYQSLVDGLTEKAIISKIFEKKNLMIIIQTKEGHVFGSYYSGQIKKTNDFMYIDEEQQKHHFAFSLINPHHTQPIKMKKKKEYNVALRLNDKTREVISVPSFFFIFSDSTSYISTNYDVAYEHLPEYGFDLFCEGKDYTSPHKVSFNLSSVCVVEWTSKN